MENNRVSILWISDIHFSQTYKDVLAQSGELKNYFTQFLSKISTRLNEGEVFRYVFLTGDLAQAGIMADYELMFKEFLKPLLDLFATVVDKPKVVVIPGNHDVDWSKTDFLKTYLEGIIPLIEQDQDRSLFLKQHFNKFEKLFSDYSKFLLEYVMDYDGGRYKQYFELNESATLYISPMYRQNRLFGYLIDHQNRMIINLLNTAWFSLGGRFNHILAELESHDSGWLIGLVNSKDPAKFPTIGEQIRYNTQEQLKKTLRKKEFISEYNNQITGINMFEFDELTTHQTMYSEYFVITCMHHPFNWLKWDELYSFKDDTRENANRMQSLLKMSNLVLTGHEHVPKEIKSELRSASCLLLKSGCFLFDNQHYKVNLANGWFSVLHIEPERVLVEQDKYFYLDNGPAVNWHDIMARKSREQQYRLKKTGDRYLLHPDRAEHIELMFKKTDQHTIENVLNRLWDNANPVQSARQLETTAAMRAFLLERAQHQELCFFALAGSAYKYFRSPEFFELLRRLMEMISDKNLVIRFLVPDMFVDDADLSELSPDAAEVYLQVDRWQQLEQRVTLADDMFDVMRHEYFSTFEDEFEASSKLDPVFEIFRECRLVNTILPFWVAENLWRNTLPDFIVN